MVQPGHATVRRRWSRIVTKNGDLASPIYVLTIAVTLFLSWWVTLELGGAGAVAPHWLYIPIMLSAYRFGFAATFLVSLVAGFVVGPIMPDHFFNGVAFPQVTSDWVSRSIDFVVLGQFMALLFRNLRRQRDAARASLYDPLTGLPNRVLFQERIEEGLAQLDRLNGSLGVLFLDLDDFKAVNDAHGHFAGDELLVAISSRFLEAVGPGATLARISGDEFAVLVDGPQVRDLEGVAQRVLDALQAPFVIADTTTAVHVSIGIASTIDGTHSAGELLRNADIAMYAAKRAGKNRCQVFQVDLVNSGR